MFFTIKICLITLTKLTLGWLHKIFLPSKQQRIHLPKEAETRVARSQKIKKAKFRNKQFQKKAKFSNGEKGQIKAKFSKKIY